MDQKLRDDMLFLYGQIEALGFVVCHDKGASDLWESISTQYQNILSKLTNNEVEPRF